MVDNQYHLDTHNQLLFVAQTRKAFDGGALNYHHRTVNKELNPNLEAYYASHVDPLLKAAGYPKVGSEEHYNVIKQVVSNWRNEKIGDDIPKDEGAVPHKDNGGGITAYHGSPHEFEQFDLSKIGSGEGQQAYGHGMYFAEREPVAKEYRDRLAREEPSQGGTMADAFSLSPEQYGMMDEEDMAAHVEDIQNHAINTIFEKGVMKHVFDDGSALIDDMSQMAPVRKAKGHMYEVSINAHPDHFLDWDKPLSEQSEHVQKLLEPYAIESANSMNKARKESLERHESGYRSIFKMTPERLAKLKEVADHNTFTGEALYNMFQIKLGAIRQGEKAEDASNLLASMGIKGIKYLDAGSRGKTENPSRNYVVFDDKLVNVKRRYARGGAVPHNELDPAKEYKKQTGKVHPDLKIEQPIEGTKERMSNMRADVPVRWASSPDHPSAHLAYITDEEAELLKRADLHDSNIANEHHVGPGGVPSYQGGGIGSGGSSYSGNGGMDSPSESGPGPGMGGGSSTGGGGGGGGGGSSIGIGGGGGGGGGSSIGGGGGGSSMPGIGLGSVDAFGAPGSMKTFGSSDPGQEADKSMVDALSAGMKPGGDIGSSFVKEAISPDLSGGNSPLASGISQYDRSALDAQMDRMRAGQQAERNESYERSVIGPVTKQINVPNAGDLYGATNAPLALQPPSGMFGEPTMGTTTFGTGARSVGFPSQQTGPMDPSQVGYAEQMAKSARQAWLDANTEPESPRLGDLATPTPNRPFTTPNRAGSVGSMPIGTTPRMADLTPLSSQPARPVTPTPFSTFPQDVQKQMIPVRSDASYGQTLIDPSGEYTQEALKNWNLAQDAVTMLNSPTLAGSIMRGVASITKGITPATPEEQADINRLYQRTYGGGQTSSGQSVRQNFDQAFAAARASGAETFSWTNPATGQKGIYTTQLGRKAGGRVPSLKEPEQWIAQTSKPAAIRKTAKPRTSSKVDGTAIVRRAVMLSSRKS